MANARRGAACAAGTLVGGSAADSLDHQRINAAIRVVARDTGESAVDHDTDAVDGDRRFGDVGGDHHFAAAARFDSGVLIAR